MIDLGSFTITQAGQVQHMTIECLEIANKVAGLSTTKRNLREPANPELRDESYEFALNLSNSVLTELDMDNVSMDCSLCDSTFDYLIELINHKSTVHDPMLMPGINAN